jgi:4-amino-4-deoxy-L-arabinose transferase-like glycosyltransferase
MINLNIRDGQILAAIVALAILLRWIFFMVISVPTSLTQRRFWRSLVVWPISNISALFAMAQYPGCIFHISTGPSEFSANQSFLCSFGEIIVVYLFARQLWGVRAAWLAALLLAFLPLHVHYAGRLMADSPLAFFITLSFYFFWLAEQQRRILWYVLAGVSAGLVFSKNVFLFICWSSL